MRCSLLLFVACGAVAGALIASMLPAGLRSIKLHDQQFRLVRPSQDPVEVTAARWFFLPLLYGDFDLQMDIEISEGAEVDLLLRQVEPRKVGEETLPFAGRFTALRLSSNGDGVGWRTREQALFGPTGDGVGLAPGYLATVWVQARGRMLRANVAGKWQPWHQADDTYGMCAVIVKGGNAVLHAFQVTPLADRLWLWSRWTWALLGAVGALVIAAFALALGEHRPRFVGGGVGLMLTASWLAKLADLDLGFPEPSAMLQLLGSSLVIALVLLSRQARLVVLLPLLLLATWLAVLAMPGLQHDTREVDAVFGPDAGAQLSEAHAQLVRGPTGLHDVGGSRPRVFLLGGQVIYGLLTPGEHLELLIGTQLRGVLRKPVDVPCLATMDGYPSQQWRLFTQFFAGYRPHVIVLGVGPELPDEPPRYSSSEWTATVRAAQEYCRQHEQQLVLFADHGFAPPEIAELRELAGDDLPLVVREQDEARAAVARRLAAAILPSLR